MKFSEVMEEIKELGANNLRKETKDLIDYSLSTDRETLECDLNKAIDNNEIDKINYILDAIGLKHDYLEFLESLPIPILQGLVDNAKNTETNKNTTENN